MEMRTVIVFDDQVCESSAGIGREAHRPAAPALIVSISGPAAVDEQYRSGDRIRVARCQEHGGAGQFLGLHPRARPAETFSRRRMKLSIRLRGVSFIGVSIQPGAIALT